MQPMKEYGTREHSAFHGRARYVGQASRRNTALCEELLMLSTECGREEQEQGASYPGNVL